MFYTFSDHEQCNEMAILEVVEAVRVLEFEIEETMNEILKTVKTRLQRSNER